MVIVRLIRRSLAVATSWIRFNLWSLNSNEIASYDNVSYKTLVVMFAAHSDVVFCPSVIIECNPEDLTVKRDYDSGKDQIVKRDKDDVFVMGVILE